MLPSVPLPRMPYQAGLNSLRAVAALSVCCFHFYAGQLPEREQVPFTKEVFLHGYVGVYIFFVISGFIIPYSLLAKNYRPQDFGTYLRRRLIRINPPAYAAMLLTVAQWILTDRFINHSTFYTHSISAGRVMHNILFTVPFSPHKWFVEACWTLATELQFYLLVGLLFAVVYVPARNTWFVLTFMLLAAIGASHLLPLATLFVMSPLFALGGVTLRWQQGQMSTVAFAGWLVVFTSFAFFLNDWYVAGSGLATALAIVLIRKPLLSLDWIGKISYSLYLTHMVVGRLAEFILFRLFAPTSASARTLVTSLCVAIALGVAALFYRWVERPFIRLAAR